MERPGEVRVVRAKAGLGAVCHGVVGWVKMGFAPAWYAQVWYALSGGGITLLPDGNY